MRLLSILLLLIYSTGMCGTPMPKGEEWLLEQEKRGIKIFTKKSKWGKFKDARALMAINSTPEEVLNLLTDIEKLPNWMPKCKTARRLANINENEFIVRIVFNAPWPFKDRECILRIKIEKLNGGGYVVYQDSEPRYLKDNEGLRRIERMNAVWRITPIADNLTEVDNEYSSDAGGDIPDWLLNATIVENPLQTFNNIQQTLPATTKR